ncbi:hypothetical protein [Streptomyces sp. SID5910]|uniref:hypothetical protein n=1 Tax=Streptomyces sp. SID5910 TaxID=2690312 RepID=UPI00136CF137|nr:hypothetical protein [Streptomyces sp. SID5910]MYR45074.1 hypothetical protein [Streptomyces sp. SID5910]
MNTRTAAATLAAAALLTLTACSSSGDDSKTNAAPTATTTGQASSPAAAGGLPPKPTGEKRQQLLDALAKAAPDVVRYEDKAIDAARNQCSAFGEGVKRPDWLASQRFTYKDVTTSEEQGKQINEALKSIGFCNV